MAYHGGANYANTRPFYRQVNGRAAFSLTTERSGGCLMLQKSGLVPTDWRNGLYVQKPNKGTSSSMWSRCCQPLTS
jgi:hypothetical protein